MGQKSATVASDNSSD